MINDKEFESFIDQVDTDCGNYCIEPQEALNMWRDAVELRLSSKVEQRADNSDYAKCADEILLLDLADEVINKRGCIVSILRRHFA